MYTKSSSHHWNSHKMMTWKNEKSPVNKTYVNDIVTFITDFHLFSIPFY